MDLATIKAFIDPITPVLVGLAALALADLASGIGGAFRSGTFDANKVGQWIGTHILGRVLPIAVMCVLGTQSTALAALAAMSVSLYTIETLKSVAANLGVPAPTN